MHLPRWAVLIIALVLLSVGAIGAAGADGGYDLSMDTAVEVPERTVENPENKSEEFTIATVGRTTPGESTTVDISPPTDTRYSVFFREQDGDPVDFANRLRGDQSVTLNTGGEPAGSYIITTGETSAPDAVLPVVIEAYVVNTLELDGTPLAGSTITDDSSHNITVHLTDQSKISITTVTLTLWTESEGVVHEVTLNQAETDPTTFDGSISNINQGEYNAQVRIRGGDIVNGETELIGLSDTQPFTVDAPASDNNDGTDDSSSTDDTNASHSGTGDGSSGPDNTDDTRDTDTGISNESDPTDEDDGSTTNTTTDSSDTTSSNGDGNSSDESDSENATNSESSNGTDNPPTSDEVIEPNTNTSDSTSNDSTPLNAVPLVLALTVTAAAVRRVLNTLRVD